MHQRITLQGSAQAAIIQAVGQEQALTLVVIQIVDPATQVAAPRITIQNSARRAILPIPGPIQALIMMDIQIAFPAISTIVQGSMIRTVFRLQHIPTGRLILMKTIWIAY
jgi:hypothetical protein